jgi:hypothetical protein
MLRIILKTDGCEVVSLKLRQRFTIRKYSLVLISICGCIYSRAIAELEGIDK